MRLLSCYNTGIIVLKIVKFKFTRAPEPKWDYFMRMNRESTLTIGLVFLCYCLSGCAHSELKSPCDPLAVTASLVDCGPEKPVNVAGELTKPGAVS